MVGKEFWFSLALGACSLAPFITTFIMRRRNEREEIRSALSGGTYLTTQIRTSQAGLKAGLYALSLLVNGVLIAVYYVGSPLIVIGGAAAIALIVAAVVNLNKL